MNDHLQGMTRRKVVGIDLGTTFSAIAHVDEFGQPEIIPNSESERITPSVILFEGREAIIGTTAKQNAVAEPEKIVDFVKREMGKATEQFHREFGGRAYSAEELSALIIRKLKKDAEKFTGETITDAVITVPAYFNDAERTATVRAGKLAGLNVLRIINEPTAAAIAYGLHKHDTRETVLVFDLGGGTFDVTVMRVEPNEIRMLASHGDHHLGGKDWDDEILHWVATEFEAAHGINPLLDLQSYQDLYNRALSAKLQLTTRSATTLVHSYSGKSIKVEISREDFESRCRHLLERCKLMTELAMREAGVKPSEIDRVVLAGGMTRVPSVRQMIERAIPASIATEVNPDECVAVGAAVAGILAQCDEERETGDKILAPKVAERYCRPNGKPLSVTDITTHTLGLVLWNHEKREEYVFPMIPRRTPIPTARKDSFASSRKAMRSATVRVVEGESSLPGECNLLGTCTIDFPRMMEKGAAVEITYSYTRNQVLEVTVKACNCVNRVQIARGSNFSEAETAEITAELAQIEIL